MSRTLLAMCVLLVLVSGQESQEPETKLISSEITLDLEIQIEVEEPDNAWANKTREDKLGPTIQAVEATLYEEDFEDYEEMENENVSTKSDNTTLPILVSKRTTGGLSNIISVTSQPSDTSQNMSDKSTTNKERTIQQNMTMLESSTTTSSDERTFESDNGYVYGNNGTESYVNISTVETVKKENYSNVSLVQLLFFFIFVFVMGIII